MTADAAPPQGVPFPALESANDLGDQAVVDLLVREFVDRALNIFHAVTENQRTLDDGVGEIGELAEKYNSVFLGLDSTTSAQIHPWNSPEQLGTYLRDSIGLDFPPEECVRAALIHVVTTVMHIIQGSPDDWEEDVEAIRVEIRDLLLGRSADEEAGGDDLPM